MRESEVTGNCHASFGERDGETHRLKDLEVRSVPTLFSPLLANVALHGMEQTIRQTFPITTQKVNGQLIRQGKVHFIRYADDFVVLHDELTVIQRCQTILANWLAPMGLELKPSKTTITHTLHEYEGKTGFDFLGFTVRQFPAGKHRSGLDNKRLPLGFKAVMKPSTPSIKRHCERLTLMLKRHRTSNQELLINELNPVIRGWTNYYSAVSSSKQFARLTHVMFRKLWRWAQRRHPRKGAYWLRGRYWGYRSTNWRFRTPDQRTLLVQHSDTHIRRYVKVMGTRSPFDGDWVYWGTRMGRHPEAGTRISFLLKQQRGRCRHCNLFFRYGDRLEVDHKVSRSAGGSDRYNNLQLLHRHCHDTKTATDGKGATLGKNNIAS